MDLTSNKPRLDDKDKALLEVMQEEFPLVENPYIEIANRVGLSEAAVLSRLKRLIEQGSIRKFRALVDKSRLGITANTLIGMKVPPERLAEVMKQVQEFNGVTHNYAREHEYNLWYVIEASDQKALEQINEQIKQATGITDTLNLPALRRFKLRLKVDVVK